MVLCDDGHAQEAIAACRQAIALNPDLAIAHSNLSLVLLTFGHFEEGWREHEWRLKCGPKFRPRLFHQGQWNGEDIAGKTILLYAEQGFGDAIQFARYAPLMADLGAKVVLECHPELVQLFTSLRGIERLVAAGEPLPDFDFHCPVLSLPLAFERRLKIIPAQVPYISPGPQLIDQWKRRIGPKTDAFKAGIVWAGRPTHTNDRHRSMKLRQFAPLAGIEHLEFYSLQKGPATTEMASAPPGFRLYNFTSDLADFVDTAAMIANLDMIIAVDTAVAHLAGALGKNVWVMLPYAADWRWLRGRNDSPWYPTMRLFRQKSWGDWDGVVGEVRQALAAWVAQPESPQRSSPIQCDL